MRVAWQFKHVVHATLQYLAHLVCTEMSLSNHDYLWTMLSSTVSVGCSLVKFVEMLILLWCK